MEASGWKEASGNEGWWTPSKKYPKALLVEVNRILLKVKTLEEELHPADRRLVGIRFDLEGLAQREHR